MAASPWSLVIPAKAVFFTIMVAAEIGALVFWSFRFILIIWLFWAKVENEIRQASKYKCFMLVG
jgi:hypothetical protein